MPQKHIFILGILIFILFLFLKHYSDKRDKLESEQAKKIFYHDSFQWLVKNIYIDSSSHMSYIMTIRSFDKDSVFDFMPSHYRLPRSFYKYVQSGDTILKDTNSLKILISSGLRKRIIQCDTWFWSDKPIPYSP